ncbi:MAG: hypothetical protein ACYCZZ_03220 [Minisyncoccota bacterium]
MDTPPLGTILQKESYLAMIRNAEGTHLFRNLYATVDGDRQDILKDGQLSCAAFVSFVLHSFYLVETPHATVAGLERDLLNSGWHKVETPSPGDVLVWESKLQGDAETAHVGFYLGDDHAISNDWQMRVPAKHHMTFGSHPDGTPSRAITAIYTSSFLEQKVLSPAAKIDNAP